MHAYRGDVGVGTPEGGMWLEFSIGGESAECTFGGAGKTSAVELIWCCGVSATCQRGRSRTHYRPGPVHGVRGPRRAEKSPAASFLVPAIESDETLTGWEDDMNLGMSVSTSKLN
ncbi:hypothetical protein B0H11DRAFT_1919182 [Mycena galericulata]|nr:hypothetical protein B0H11DRAFT_1919182 [Mycena galericulata]